MNFKKKRSVLDWPTEDIKQGLLFFLVLDNFLYNFVFCCSAYMYRIDIIVTTVLDKMHLERQTLEQHEAKKLCLQ